MQNEPECLPPHLIPGDEYDAVWYCDLLSRHCDDEKAHRISALEQEKARRHNADLPDRTCPKCNADAEIHARFCVRCGQELAGPFIIPQFLGPIEKERPQDSRLAERFDERVKKAQSDQAKGQFEEMQREVWDRWDRSSLR